MNFLKSVRIIWC